jgi:ribosome hibernation promoting factor
MQIDIQARHFSLTNALRSHAEHRLRLALTCCGDHIQRIVMRLSDISSSRGKANKHCHLQVVLAGMPDVVIEDTETNLYVAINRAADRAGRTLVRRVNRQQTLLKQGRPLPIDVDQPTLSNTLNDIINQQGRGF